MGKRFDRFADIVWEWATGGYATDKRELQLHILTNSSFIPCVTFIMISSFHSIFTINYPFWIKLWWFGLPVMLFIMISFLARTIIRYRKFKKEEEMR